MTPARGGERGFVLVGVVILVLALTILGLSLFNLSGYEGQFLGRSIGSTQALYNAESGAEMVKAVLSASPFRLSDSRQAEGRYGIVRCVAKQQKTNPIGGGLYWDSTGTVSPDPLRPVWVTVVARQGTSERMIEAYYTPGRRQEYYKRLFTTFGSIDVAVTSTINEPNRRGTTWLDGDILETNAGAQNYLGPDVHWDMPPDTVLRDTVGIALLRGPGGYFERKLPFATTLTGGFPSDLGSNGTTTYYVGPGPSNQAFYDLPGGGELELQVRGRVVWMFPSGLRLDSKLKVERGGGGGGDATLVIVAGPNGGTLSSVPGPYDHDIGIWFFDRFDVDHHVRLILVSDGKVWLEYAASDGESTEAERLSVFAGGGAQAIRTLGPKAGYSMRFRYDPSMDAEIDYLLQNDHLPLPQGSAIRSPFTLVPGSWRDLSR